MSLKNENISLISMECSIKSWFSQGRIVQMFLPENIQLEKDMITLFISFLLTWQESFGIKGIIKSRLNS